MTKRKRDRMLYVPYASHADDNLTTFIRRFIASSLAGGEPTVTKAAEAADLGVRTLQRRLLEAVDARFGVACPCVGDQLHPPGAYRGWHTRFWEAEGWRPAISSPPGTP